MRDRGEIVQVDIGGWLSGSMFDGWASDAATAAALEAGCTAHAVPAGTPCPLIGSGACRARRAAASGDDW